MPRRACPQRLPTCCTRRRMLNVRGGGGLRVHEKGLYPGSLHLACFMGVTSVVKQLLRHTMFLRHVNAGLGAAVRLIVPPDIMRVVCPWPGTTPLEAALSQVRPAAVVGVAALLGTELGKLWPVAEPCLTPVPRSHARAHLLVRATCHGNTCVPHVPRATHTLSMY